MTASEELSSEDNQLWQSSELAQAAGSLPKTGTQEHFRQTYFLPDLKTVMDTVTDNKKKNEARAIKRGRSAMANPPSREP